MKRIGTGIILAAVVASVAYLATLGCCQLLASAGKPKSLTDQLRLSPAQRGEVASLEKGFMEQKNKSCELLCEKRAQLIQLLRQPEPDRTLMARLVDEIGQEQTALERATVEHLMAVREKLDPSQRERFTALMAGEFRDACKSTSCGMTPGCAVHHKNPERG